MSDILVGSCSWTDPTLIACGRFYPAGVTSAAQRLRYYAGQFPLVEVDSTYYAPPVDADQRPLGRADAPRASPSTSRPSACSPAIRRASSGCRRWLRDAVSPACLGKQNVYRKDIDPGGGRAPLGGPPARRSSPCALAGRLGALLFQFPPWFRKNRENVAYLSDLPARLPGTPSPSSSAAAAGWRASTAPRTLRPARGRGARIRERRRAPGLPVEHPARVRRHSRRLPWSACTGATPTTWEAKSRAGVRQVQVPLLGRRARGVGAARAASSPSTPARSTCSSTTTSRTGACATRGA